MLSDKQKKGLKLLNDPRFIYYLFDGSSRSGKTFLYIAWLCAFCKRYPGVDTLVGRYHFSTAKASIWNKTLVPYLKEAYDGFYEINKSDFIITFKWGSTISLGGFEEGDRLDKILGTEWAVILMNEGTENSYQTYQTLKTRLNSPISPIKFLIDCNPKAPSHWLHKQFIEKVNPETRKRLPLNEVEEQTRLYYHVNDNKANLNDRYISILESMTGLKRKRFLDGIWSEATEGGVYRFSREANHVEEPIKYIDGAITWTGIDFGIADNVFIVWCQFLPVPKSKDNPFGVEIHVIDEYYNNEKDYKYYANVINGKSYKDVRHAGDPSGTARNASLQSWISLLATEGIHIKYRNGVSVADHISNANRYLPHVRICEDQCPKTVEMFENWSYPKNKDGKVVEGKLPVHDEYSHPGTAFYYMITQVYPPIKNEIILP